MIIVRGARPERDFAIISNAVLRDARLSFRARGILCFILSFPDNFQVSSERLSAAGREGRDAVRSSLTELETTGYLTREKRQNSKGLWETTVIVSDTPSLSTAEDQPTTGFQSSVGVSPETEEPTTGNPTTGNPTAGFPGAIKNTDKNIKKKKEEGGTPISFNGSSFENLTGEQVHIWIETYPAINVAGEIKKAAAWLDANPKNRKSDYKRFLNNWLCRAQDRAPRVAGPGLQMPRSKSAKATATDDYHAQMAQIRTNIYGTPNPDGGQANVERDITGECTVIR